MTFNLQQNDRVYGGTSRDYWTMKAMVLMGGSFVSALGRAAQCASDIDRDVIKNTWPTYWYMYEKRGKQLEANYGKKEVRQV